MTVAVRRLAPALLKGQDCLWEMKTRENLAVETSEVTPGKAFMAPLTKVVESLVYSIQVIRCFWLRLEALEMVNRIFFANSLTNCK